MGVVNQLKNLGVENYISAQETFLTLQLYNFLKFVQKNPDIITEDLMNSYYSNKYDAAFVLKDLNINYMMGLQNNKENILICMPAKTGDYTINATLRHNNVAHLNTFHKTRFFTDGFGKEIYERLTDKVKIITAVREPVGQNISTYTHLLSLCGADTFNLFRSIIFNLAKNDANSMQELIDVLFKNGGNAQALFDMQMEKLADQSEDNIAGSRLQEFITSFRENIIDIMKEPFDKEKGYSVVKEGRIEVFVFQIEKLNSIIPAFSKWVGVPFDSLENDNVGEEKWNGNFYKQVQNEIQFSQEYIDKCYSEPYVKHFYSEEDIDKFKKYWSKNLKENK